MSNIRLKLSNISAKPQVIIAMHYLSIRFYVTYTAWFEFPIINIVFSILSIVLLRPAFKNCRQEHTKNNEAHHHRGYLPDKSTRHEEDQRMNEKILKIELIIR